MLEEFFVVTGRHCDDFEDWGFFKDSDAMGGCVSYFMEKWDVRCTYSGGLMD